MLTHLSSTVRILNDRISSPKLMQSLTEKQLELIELLAFMISCLINSLMNINARILSFSGFDISKLNFIELLLSRHSSWNGRVIVKTDKKLIVGLS